MGFGENRHQAANDRRCSRNSGPSSIRPPTASGVSLTGFATTGVASAPAPAFPGAAVDCIGTITACTDRIAPPNVREARRCVGATPGAKLRQDQRAYAPNGGSSWAINVTYEDPSGVFPSPRSPTPTGFTLLAGSSNQFVSVGSSMLPIAGYQFSLNAPSSVGASVTFVALQVGIG